MIYQGICTVNCESKAAYPQRIHMKDIVMGWIELTGEGQYHSRMKMEETILVYLN